MLRVDIGRQIREMKIRISVIEQDSTIQ